MVMVGKVDMTNQCPQTMNSNGVTHYTFKRRRHEEIIDLAVPTLYGFEYIHTA